MKGKGWLKIGEDFDPKIKNKVFVLNVYEHVKKTEYFDPKSYFITSGDAIFKMKFMLSELQDRINKEKDSAVVQSLSTSLSEARLLNDKLLKARGPDCFLETEWEQHELKCIPKNPRASQEL